MAPLGIPLTPYVVDEATQRDFLWACGLVVASTLVSFVCSRRFDVHAGKELAAVPRAEVTVEQRVDATDKLLCIPYFALVGCLALAASRELHATVDARWHGQTATSRWCMLLYCAKQAVDVPVQTWTLRKSPAKRVQMVGHHALSFVAIGLGLVTGRCHFFACFAVCSELSTPFLSTVMAIKLLGGGRTPAQRTCQALAGAGLWLAYLPFRLALFPCWLYVFLADQRDAPATTRDAATTFELRFYPAVIAFLLVLSCVWFVAISRGLYKALSQGGAKKRA